MKEAALSDHRRAHLRFEVMGKMPGAVVSTETLQVVNLAANGVLVEASCPLPENAEYLMQLVLDRHVSEANVKVRRVTTLPAAGAAPPRYRMGLEFLTLSREAEDEINRIVVASLAAEI